MLYKRVLVKVSGQIMRRGEVPIDMATVHQIVQQIVEVWNMGVQVAIVVGAGNFFRGAQLADQGLSRVTSDNLGMISTNINALALLETLDAYDVPCSIMSALPVGALVPPVDIRGAKDRLSKGEVVIFAGGTGNALVTTDSAASLRAIEIEADILLKGTRVDGVYSDDPEKSNEAKRYDKITFAEVLEKSLEVMDQGAFRLCQEFALPVCVFNIQQPNALSAIIKGKAMGTLINGDKINDD